MQRERKIMLKETRKRNNKESKQIDKDEERKDEEKERMELLKLNRTTKK